MIYMKKKVSMRIFLLIYKKVIFICDSFKSYYLNCKYKNNNNIYYYNLYFPFKK